MYISVTVSGPGDISWLRILVISLAGVGPPQSVTSLLILFNDGEAVPLECVLLFLISKFAKPYFSQTIVRIIGSWNNNTRTIANQRIYFISFCHTTVDSWEIHVFCMEGHITQRLLCCQLTMISCWTILPITLPAPTVKYFMYSPSSQKENFLRPINFNLGCDVNFFVIMPFFGVRNNNTYI